MRSALIASSLLATLALSSPLAKRYYVTETEMVTVFEYVTIPPSEAAATDVPVIRPDPGSTVVDTTTVYESSTPETPAPTPEPTTEEVPAPAPTPEPTTEAPQPSAPAATSAAPAPTGANDYQKAVLNQHNLHRANHSAAALEWDSELESIAQTIANSCVYEHNTAAGGGGYGQNIGAGTTPEDVGSMITNLMYNGEINFYPPPFGNDNPDMSNFHQWGHFSQIVWASTTHLACVTQHCPGGLANTGGNIPPYFTVCNYKPAGNFAGEYHNVGKPLGQASITA